MRRLAAILSLVLVAVVAIAAALYVDGEPGPLILVLVLFVVVTAAAWAAVTREGALRWIATAVVVLGLVGYLIAFIVYDSELSIVWRVVALAVAVVLARYAI